MKMHYKAKCYKNKGVKKMPNARNLETVERERERAIV